MYERFTVLVDSRSELVRELVCVTNQNGRFVQAIPWEGEYILVFEREITPAPTGPISSAYSTLLGDPSE